MRPLDKPEWRPEWQEHPPADVVLAALGRFCAACERRLPQAAVAWHVGREAPLAEGLTADDWPDMIPLCHNCAWAAEHSAVAVDDLLLPHRAGTFTLDERSPFRYERAPGDGAQPERVLAAPANDQARATAEYFALNEHRPAVDGPLDLEPGDDLLTRDYIDPRLELRTRAWEIAQIAATQIAAAGPEQRTMILELARVTAEETGFWSTWATVLWHELSDREVLEQVLQPPAAGGAPPPHPFPATRPGWLPPAGSSGG